MDGSITALEEGLARIGLRVEDVEQVLLTHQHHDHVGLAATIRGRSGAQVAAVEPLARYLADYDLAMQRDDAYAVALMRRHGLDEQTVTTLDSVSRAFRRYSAGVHVDRPLRDGDELIAGGRRFTVRRRPGHSPTDTVFEDSSGELLIGGDHLLQRISSNPIAHVPIDDSDPVAIAASPDRPRPLVAYMESMRQTAARDAGALVLPGHGEPFAGVADLVERRMAMHERRLRKIRRTVEGGCTAGDIGSLLWRQVPVTQAYLVLSEVLAHLDVLAQRGEVEEVDDGGGVARYAAAA